MVLFLIAALVTLCVIVALVRPLLRDMPAPEPPEAFNAAVYRDQLAEVGADVSRQTIRPEDAAGAQAEIERRLLRTVAERPGAQQTEAPVRPAPKLAALVLAGLMSVGAGAMYLGLGSPDAALGRPGGGVGGAPIAANDEMHAQMDELVVNLTRRLEENPNDAEGWALLARTQIRLGRAPEAVSAYARAMDLSDGADRQLTAEYAEARVIALGGEVDAESQALFQRLLRDDRQDPQARYYLALAKGQSGDLPGAIADWRALEADSPADAPWRETLTRQIAQAEAALGRSGPPSPPPAASGRGPTAADMAAAAEMGEAERDAMVEGMVAGLAARLEREPNDVEGWRRLARAYDVLGRPRDAAAAHARVVALSPNDPDALWRLGEIAAASGDVAGARRHWTALDRSLPRTSPQRARVQEALAGLPPR